MQKRNKLTMIPFFIGAIALWCVLYQRTDVLVHLYRTGENNPLIFVLVVGFVMYKLAQFLLDNK